MRKNTEKPEKKIPEKHRTQTLFTQWFELILIITSSNLNAVNS